jgi:lipopolysaccharide transport system ATP-binding protein
MSEPIIKVEGLGKKYIISHEGKESYRSLRDIISRRAKHMAGGFQKEQQSKEEFWALKDVNFEIKQGDAVGIIGRNGAGKSTLLKILSRITEPTHGRIEINGRIASLLEVGTGFHPELTGRENIFLNGAILGMSRVETKRKFDEIVDFSGVEKFLDTPVKRYSSGMYVRLAFAVAAHLEPEILVVDEVLAVGDAEFQKKCLGKMNDVSKNEGRTVLFVSHQMGTIAQLCDKAIFLHKGSVQFIGSVDKGINEYLKGNSNSSSYNIEEDKTMAKTYFISEASIFNEEDIQTNTIEFGKKLSFRFKIRAKDIFSSVKLSCTIQSKTGEYLSTFVEELSKYSDNDTEVSFEIVYETSNIAPNSYAFRLALFSQNGIVYDLAEMICPFQVVDNGTDMAQFEGINYGYYITKHTFLRL